MVMKKTNISIMHFISYVSTAVYKWRSYCTLWIGCLYL